MSAEPRALRLTILVTTVFVLAGAAGGFFLWYLAYHEAARPREVPSGATIPASVEPWPGTSDAQAERLRRAVASLLGTRGPTERRKAEEILLAAGELAVPFLLEGTRGLFDAPRDPSEPGAFGGQHVLDRVLSSLRRDLTPQDPAPPWMHLPDEAWARRRAEGWFAWWEGYRARSAPR